MNLLTMKLLFDLFPVILFFAAFKIAEGQPDAAIALAERFMGEGLTAMTAPVFIATVVAIAATFLQVGWLMLRGRKVEPMLWISLAVIVVFGSLTLYLRNEMFIKWKPTILYWIFGGILVYGNIRGPKLHPHASLQSRDRNARPRLGCSRTCGSAFSRPWASSTSSSPTSVRPTPGSTSSSSA